MERGRKTKRRKGISKETIEKECIITNEIKTFGRKEDRNTKTKEQGVGY